MADEILYKHPSVETKHFMDFTDELPDDASVVLATSTVTATNSAGTASPTVVGTTSISGMKLYAVLQAGANGDDYAVTFVGRGVTTGRDAAKTVELRVRADTGIS